MSKAEILRLLKEADTYISGQYLCEVLQVSRTAVWKQIAQLKKAGYEIEAVRNKGYLLKKTPAGLTAAEIESRMSAKVIGRTLKFYAATDSTNLRARALGEAGAAHGTLVVADGQQAGKGRRGRTWDSPVGTNVYLSLLLYPPLPPAQAPQLTLVMALAAARAIRQQTKLDITIKWPNDLLYQEQKVAGILTEMSTELEAINYVVIGLGVNVNTAVLPAELTTRATSLYLAGGKPVDRAALIARICTEFEPLYEKFLTVRDLSFMQAEYNDRLVNLNRKVRIAGPGTGYEGRALGITKTGELQVETTDGTVREVFAGEVSVRGSNGYV